MSNETLRTLYCKASMCCDYIYRAASSAVMYHYHSTEVSGAAAASASWTSLLKHQPDVLSSYRKKKILSFRGLYIFYQDSESWLLFFVKSSRSGPSLLEAIKASTCLNCSKLGTSICSLTIRRCPLKTYSCNIHIGGLHCPKSTQVFNEECFISSWAYRDRSITSCLGDFSRKAKVNLQVGRSHTIPLQCCRKQEYCLKLGKDMAFPTQQYIMENKFWPYPKVILCLFPMLLALGR